MVEFEFKGSEGPFTATADDIDSMLGEWSVRDGDGNILCHVPNPHSSYDLAVVYANDPCCPLEDNARLFAASWELFEALKEATLRMQSLGQDTSQQVAALAHATGDEG